MALSTNTKGSGNEYSAKTSDLVKPRREGLRLALRRLAQDQTQRECWFGLDKR